ncbi:MAG: TonB-dependent receptor [Bacteroidota bacterium]
MKKTIFTFILALQCLLSLSQATLEGTVRDDEGNFLAGAGIYISEIKKGTVTDNTGRFYLSNIKTGKYLVEISFIGFQSQAVTVETHHEVATRLDIRLREGSLQLADLTISASQDRPVNTLWQADIKLRPVNTSQDILRMIPGLFIGQHAGGGKAEQIFLRGFDIDHGTDINIEVDGMPVNMVSHAHGQGYADLHFVIPELIGIVDFDKGPYFADKGDLSTAGYVAFQTKARLDHNFVKAEGGNFGFARLAGGLGIPLRSKKSNAYFATEIFRTDSYFESSQNLVRFNAQMRCNTELNDRTMLQAGISTFDSHWDASGQVPDRAVASGAISRFGSIDNTEGGNTGRFNAFVKSFHNFRNGAMLENQLYATRYNFSLFSNFTFYLHDPIDGDQIHQREKRWIFGYKSHYSRSGSLYGKDLRTEIGSGVRYDGIDDIALSHTVKRTFLGDVKRGDIRQANINAYWSETLSLTDKFSIHAAIRFDYLHFLYLDKLTDGQSDRIGRSTVNPKLNFNYEVDRNVNVFFRLGSGFHSNDTRVVVSRSGREILPKAYGADVGTNLKLGSDLFLQVAFWRLDMEQEFVYVGDEGVIEPSGKTRREGIDASIRYQFNAWLFADVDVNFTNPRSRNVAKGKDHIPLAPLTTSIGGLSFKKENGFNGSLRYRYMADRPANEDNSVVAKGYFITDAILNYVKPGYTIGLAVENLFNKKWKETQFDTESRLLHEAQPVSEIHFTPGTPLTWRIRFTKNI